MKVVLDTNVWISSLLLPNSIPAQIIAAWKQASFGIVTSSFILEEINKVLNYPKIKKRLLFSQEYIDEYLTFLRFFTEMADLEIDKNFLLNNLRDKNDSLILATLISSQADYLITGDNDLLILNQQYPIITPQSFATMLE